MKKTLALFMVMVLAMVGCAGQSDASDTGAPTEEVQQEQVVKNEAETEQQPSDQTEVKTNESTPSSVEPGVTDENEVLLYHTGRYDVFADSMSWNLRYVDRETKDFYVIPYSQITQKQIEQYNGILVQYGLKMPGKKDQFLSIPVTKENPQ